MSLAPTFSNIWTICFLTNWTSRTSQTQGDAGKAVPMAAAASERTPVSSEGRQKNGKDKTKQRQADTAAGAGAATPRHR